MLLCGANRSPRGPLPADGETAVDRHAKLSKGGSTVGKRSKYNVVISEVAITQLDALYFCIAENGGEKTAEAFVGGIQQFCLKLADFPHRGSHRDLTSVPGLRTVGYKRRATIAFTVDDDRASVTILGVFYGGQDFERYLETGDD